jgi:hypothetical protein
MEFLGDGMEFFIFGIPEIWRNYRMKIMASRLFAIMLIAALASLVNCWRDRTRDSLRDGTPSRRAAMTDSDKGTADHSGGKQQSELQIGLEITSKKEGFRATGTVREHDMLSVVEGSRGLGFRPSLKPRENSTKQIVSVEVFRLNNVGPKQVETPLITFSIPVGEGGSVDLGGDDGVFVVKVTSVG